MSRDGLSGLARVRVQFKQDAKSFFRKVEIETSATLNARNSRHLFGARNPQDATLPIGRVR